MKLNWHNDVPKENNINTIKITFQLTLENLNWPRVVDSNNSRKSNYHIPLTTFHNCIN